MMFTVLSTIQTCLNIDNCRKSRCNSHERFSAKREVGGLIRRAIATVSLGAVAAAGQLLQSAEKRVDSLAVGDVCVLS